MDWLKDYQTLSLSELYLPGTHNSGTSIMTTQVAPDAPTSWLQLLSPWSAGSRCQALTLIEQLNIGVRYLDLRIAPYRNSLHWVHSFYAGEALSFWRELKTWLQHHPTEILILNLRRYAWNCNAQAILDEKLQSLPLIPAGSNLNVPISTFTNSSQQILIIQDIPIYSNIWPNKQTLPDLEQWLDENLPRTPTLWITQLLLTPNAWMIFKGQTPELLSLQISLCLSAWYSRWKERLRGVILLDFLTPRETEIIISWNKDHGSSSLSH